MVCYRPQQSDDASAYSSMARSMSHFVVFLCGCQLHRMEHHVEQGRLRVLGEVLQFVQRLELVHAQLFLPGYHHIYNDK